MGRPRCSLRSLSAWLATHSGAASPETAMPKSAADRLFFIGRFWPRENSDGTLRIRPGVKGRRPWNAGRKLGAKRALKPQQVWAVRFWLDREGRLRDRARLRGCDVVKVKIGHLVVGGPSTSGSPESGCGRRTMARTRSGARKLRSSTSKRRKCPVALDGAGRIVDELEDWEQHRAGALYLRWRSCAAGNSAQRLDLRASWAGEGSSAIASAPSGSAAARWIRYSARIPIRAYRSRS